MTSKVVLPRDRWVRTAIRINKLATVGIRQTGIGSSRNGRVNMAKRKSMLYDYPKDELQDILNTSNSYAEVLDKLGMCKHGSNYVTLRKVINDFELDLTHINESRKQLNIDNLKKVRHDINYEGILKGEIVGKEVHGDRMKKYLLKNNYKEYVCEMCGLAEWLGKPIPLQLHHEDGNHKNNLLENLKLYCPNCHSMTDTFAGKNIKIKYKDNVKNHDTKPKKKRDSIIGWNEDHTRFYNEFGNDYKVICPVCNSNVKSKTSQMCLECRKAYESKPKIDYEHLLALWEKHHTNIGIARELGRNKETILKWLRYYKIK